MGEENKEQFPPIYEKKVDRKITDYQTKITDQDRIIFKELKHFLNGFNDDQKKSITSTSSKILCIAGAGSGKTSVLTKRIEFLIKYRGINPKKILAITFTRRAKQEMKKRLLKLDANTHVETFNSFSEKILRNYGHKIYNKPTRMINYGNKAMMVMSALNSLGLEINQAIDIYFKKFQRINKEPEQLSNLFMNDCFFILDYFKLKNKEIPEFYKDCQPEDKNSAKLIYDVCNYLQQQMNLIGLRDYTDQIIDTLKFFKQSPEFIPKFDYVLIDEYQDINDSQITLIDLLNTKNLFCVGDPRQSIFGWRGSNIEYILNFREKYSGAEIISLTKNYRSNNHIVKFINYSIKDMQLPDLNYNFKDKKELSLERFSSEDEEYQSVAEKISNSKIPRHDIFVLARTNRQLAKISQKLAHKNISLITRTDEIKNLIFEKENHVTLATIHAIKGLEAKKVFVIGCNEQNFPCKASDHPVINMIKIEDYDKEQEEKRLFYVALSRAKNKLHLTYSGKKPTPFINEDMMKILDKDKPQQTLEPIYEDSNTGNYGEFNNSNGSGYSKDYNPYGREDWDDMVG